jgi:hypothetical protein
MTPEEFEEWASDYLNEHIYPRYKIEIDNVDGKYHYDKLGTHAKCDVLIEEKHRRFDPDKFRKVPDDLLVEVLQDASTGQLGWFWFPPDRHANTMFVYSQFYGDVLVRAITWMHSDMRGWVADAQNWKHIRLHKSTKGKGLTVNLVIPIKELGMVVRTWHGA